MSETPLVCPVVQTSMLGHLKCKEKDHYISQGTTVLPNVYKPSLRLTQ